MCLALRLGAAMAAPPWLIFGQWPSQLLRRLHHDLSIVLWRRLQLSLTGWLTARLLLAGGRYASKLEDFKVCEFPTSIARAGHRSWLCLRAERQLL